MSLFFLILVALLSLIIPIKLSALENPTVSVTPSDRFSIPELVEIPGGSFSMGSLDGETYERPVHRVEINRFLMGKTEVTKVQFALFASETGYVTDAEKDSGNREGCFAFKGKSGFSWVTGTSWRFHGLPNSDTEPVVCVSWNDAQAYMGWLSSVTGGHYRLPTEAEWEYAARAGNRTQYSFGSQESALCQNTNFADKETVGFLSWAYLDCSDGYRYGAPVGSYPSNAFGLHDMHGNVWEWTEDCWYHNYENAPVNGSLRVLRDCTQRVLRGGSAGSPPKELRVSKRNKNRRHYRFIDTGFRVVRDLGTNSD